MRLSELFLPTLREAPREAEAASHRLLLRAGMIRQVAAGLYTFLPAGWRVHERIVRIVREEMNAIGAQEMLMPLLTPAELWEETGRYDIPELYRLEDRTGRRLVLALTHEETVTFHARELGSYRQLPQIWYHLALKGRDEPRARGGLVRVREFIMKDAYSFDRDEEGLDRSYWKHAGAYRRILERCGIFAYEAESDVGLMGGSVAHEYLAPCEAGQNDVAHCRACGYAANVEVAVGDPPPAPALEGSGDVETGDARTPEEVAERLGVDVRSTVSVVPLLGPDDEVVLALVRGDHELQTVKVARALGGEARPLAAAEAEERLGRPLAGPAEAGIRVLADEALREGSYVVPASRAGFHVRGVRPGQDFAAELADLRTVRTGDTCRRCGAALEVEQAVEVGNIFKLGTKYSEALGALHLDEDGRRRPIVMGSYGLGPARMLAAAVEQHHDEAGIVWPSAIAPFDAEIVALGNRDDVTGAAERLADELERTGLTVLLDDRDARAGEKFADADLLGCPVRVTVGARTLEDGMVDVRERRDGEDRRTPAERAPELVASLHGRGELAPTV